MYVGEHLILVADGLGGHVAGDVASGVVAEAVRRYDQAVKPERLAAMLGRAVKDANDAVAKRVAADPELATMGSTLVAVLHAGASAVLANVGDSRAYLLRDGTLQRLTEDHVVGNLVWKAEYVPGLPERLSRWLSGRPDGVSPDLRRLDLHPGDRLLLCSDGLSSYVSPEPIQEAMAEAADPGQVADRLVKLALEVGGPDNVTVIVADAKDPAIGDRL
jgi:serine/threonine protein phosphatase PrpC